MEYGRSLIKWEFEREEPYLEGMGRRSRRENTVTENPEMPTNLCPGGYWETQRGHRCWCWAVQFLSRTVRGYIVCVWGWPSCMKQSVRVMYEIGV